MKKNLFYAFLLLLPLACFGQGGAPTAFSSLLANKPRFALIDARVGKSFLKTEETDEDMANVFFGGACLSYGVTMNSSLWGIGGGFEYADLVDNSFSFPLFLMYRQYLGADTQKSFFMSVKAGWIFGGKTSFSTFKDVVGFPQLTGNTQRSMNGPYGEFVIGYSYQRFDFFVSYNYRMIHYDTKYIYLSPYLPNYDESWRRHMHTVVGGIGFRLL